MAKASDDLPEQVAPTIKSGLMGGSADIREWKMHSSHSRQIDQTRFVGAAKKAASEGELGGGWIFALGEELSGSLPLHRLPVGG